jgi:nitrite reductase/ring-hydroxylating ferredoxin subunit
MVASMPAIPLLILLRPLRARASFPLLRPRPIRRKSTMAKQFQLKGLTSLQLKPGQKQELEVEGLDGAKVLLVNVDNKFHALSPRCTHYGAPLIRGVLHGDRITCPWHGGMTPLSAVFGADHHSLLQCYDRRRRGCSGS